MRSISLGIASLLLASCTGSVVSGLRDPVPEPLVERAEISGYSHIRYWGDDGSSISSGTIAALIAQQAKANSEEDARNFLVVSGGGSNGAFGAGLLSGWTEAGTRPQFTIVTGISTGSLIAPFAFLGSRYDSQLRDAYTKVSGADIYRKRGVIRTLTTDAAADNAPLRKMVEAYVTDTMLNDIAREHGEGRRLLIGTTNLDAERPVVWDIGAIAASGQANRKQLIEDILVASAAIPGVFSPVRIKVVADGMFYDELHVDGGTSNQSFLFPSNLSLRALDKAQHRHVSRRLFVIRNGKVTPEYSEVKPKLGAIIGKSVGSLIKSQGIGDLYRMYAGANRDGMSFNAVWVPKSFTLQEPEPFDPTYMQSLFDLGYRMGRDGIPWKHEPP
jgi:hypothetical protein